jgi:hypothetical protein
VRVIFIYIFIYIYCVYKLTKFKNKSRKKTIIYLCIKFKIKIYYILALTKGEFSDRFMSLDLLEILSFFTYSFVPMN